MAARSNGCGPREGAQTTGSDRLLRTVRLAPCLYHFVQTAVCQPKRFSLTILRLSLTWACRLPRQAGTYSNHDRTCGSRSHPAVLYHPAAKTGEPAAQRRTAAPQTAAAYSADRARSSSRSRTAAGTAARVRATQSTGCSAGSPRRNASGGQSASGCASRTGRSRRAAGAGPADGGSGSTPPTGGRLSPLCRTGREADTDGVRSG